MTKDELRAAMPQTAAWVDEIKRVFGNESIDAIRANEGQHEIRWQARKSMAGAGSLHTSAQGGRRKGA